MESALAVLLGIGLAAACGFRVFVPFLVLSMAAQAGRLPLAEGFEWIGTPVALGILAVATVLEIIAYFVPWLDNLLDALTTPVTVVAGVLATAAVVTDLPPLLKWTLAVIAGGGVAGAVQGGSAAARLTSTVTTGGLGNAALAGLELVGSVALSILAVFAPVIGGALALLLLFLLVRLLRRRRAQGAAVIALLLISLPASGRAAPWDGAAWADYAPFLSSIPSGTKARLQTVLVAGQAVGRVEGRLGQLGDSITESNAYFRGVTLNGPTSDETGHDYAPVRSWLAYSGQQPADANSFYRDHGKGALWCNLGGWRLDDAVASGHPDSCVLVGDGTTAGDFSWALVMYGTNDIESSGWSAAAWKSDYAAFVQDLLDLGVIPVVSTIPPKAGGASTAQRVAAANGAIHEIAGELDVPLVDFHALVLFYQPTSWHGTLIGPDGVHPSAAGGGRLFSQQGLTTTDGYAARTKLTLDVAEKLRAIVFDDGPPDQPTAARHDHAGATAALAWPNPFRAGTTVRFQAGASAEASVAVLDVRGRRVRTLRAPGGGSVRTVSWDGRDRNGRPVPAGAYFLRVREGASVRVVRAVKVPR